MGVPVIACPCAVCHSSDPHDRHLRTSALVETDEHRNVLIDIGPDFREQMLRERIQRLDAILITHAHRDHVGGIDDIRPLNYMQDEKMHVFANSKAATAIQHDYRYIFEPHPFAGLPEVDLHVVEDTPFRIAGVDVMPIQAMHKDLPILGYRIGPLTYITDANYIAPSQLEKIKGTHTLVINALRKTPHFSHFCLSEALGIINLIQPQQAYLTHVSHEMGLYAEVSKELPPHVHLAYDGLQVEIRTND